MITNCPPAGRHERIRRVSRGNSCAPRRAIAAGLLTAGMLLFPSETQAEATGGAGDDGFEVQLWPVVEHATLLDGKHRTLVLFFYHRTSNPDGSTYSFNVLNYVRSPEFTSVLPLYYRVGPPGAQRTMVVPFWFQGPRYGVAPLLLTGGWTKHDGGHALWITPLAHVDTRADGA